jgi:protein-S-isoprenylcysteine O-methyltransferase Ste14
MDWPAAQADGAAEEEEATMALSAGTVIEGLWLVLGVYWVVTAPRGQAKKSSEAAGVYGLHMAMMVASCALLFSGRLGVGFLGWRFIARNPAVTATGIVVTLAGVSFAVWARKHLGENWSARPEIRVGHELVRSGPYKYVRHPIYTGILVGMMGTAIYIGKWRAIVGVTLAWLLFRAKARREEARLVEEFGPAFEERKRHTGFLFPRLG